MRAGGQLQGATRPTISASLPAQRDLDARARSDWSLTSLPDTLIKTGAKVVR